MLSPTTPHLVIIDRHGAVIHGKVVYIQPVEDRWLEDTAEMHFMTSEWLEQYRYSAVYHTVTEAVSGFFTAYKSKQVEDNDYLYKGMFEKIAVKSLS
jgi:hypothetical protein